MRFWQTRIADILPEILGQGFEKYIKSDETSDTT